MYYNTTTWLRFLCRCAPVLCHCFFNHAQPPPFCQRLLAEEIGIYLSIIIHVGARSRPPPNGSGGRRCIPTSAATTTWSLLHGDEDEEAAMVFDNDAA